MLIAVGAVYSIVDTGLNGSAKDNGPTATVSTTATKSKKPKKSTYTVRPGDSLSVISERVGVSLEHLLELNPKLDGNSLRPGQKIRIKARS